MNGPEESRSQDQRDIEEIFMEAQGLRGGSARFDQEDENEQMGSWAVGVRRMEDAS